MLEKIKNKNELTKSLTGLTVAGIFLLLSRVVYSGEVTFLFLIWNLFLAYVPFFVSSYIKNRSNLHHIGVRSLSVIFIWLIFFPNAPYILTDFIHLYEYGDVPLWFDLILISLFAWNGLIVGFISLKDMQHIVSEILV